MLPSTPLDEEQTDGEKPPTRKYLYQIDPQLLKDWEFWEALTAITLKALETPNLNPLWKLAYEQLAYSLDHLTALIFRQDQRPEFGP